MGEILSIFKNDEEIVETFSFNYILQRINEAKNRAKQKKEIALHKRNIANQLKQAVSAAKYSKESAKKARNAEKEAEDAEKAAKDAQEKAASLEKNLKEFVEEKQYEIEEVAEDAEGAAEDAEGAAEDAEGAAEDAEGAAEDAEGAVEDAEGAAEDAEGAAEDAEGAAEDAEGALEKVEQKQDEAANIAQQTLIGNPNSRIAAMGGRLQNFTNIKEGFVPSQDESAYDLLTYLKNLLEDTEEKTDVQKAIYRRKLAQSSEILAHDDNILSNILFDYMTENEEGSNIEKVYKKLDAENKNKMRKIQINTYYTKAYKEYIYLLKITVLLIAILIPILILNKIELLGKNYTLIIIVTILFLGFLYIFYRLYILYMRDDINFDKFRVPYDRQAHQMYKDGTLSKKDSPLKGLGVTCIGDECCDASMIYDNLANKCVMQENFGNYFEKMNNINNSNINVVEQFDNFDNYRENFITNDSNLKEKKNELLVESLLNTRSKTFHKPNTRII
jgi:chemotaxis protein histidine kinase CheA